MRAPFNESGTAYDEWIREDALARAEIVADGFPDPWVFVYTKDREGVLLVSPTLQAAMEHLRDSGFDGEWWPAWGPEEQARRFAAEDGALVLAPGAAP